MRSWFTLPYITTVSFFFNAILGFYLHSDLANYFVAFLYKAFIFCIPEVGQKSRVRTDKRSTYTVKSLELC